MSAYDFPSELFLPFLKTDSTQPRYTALFRAFQQAILQGDLIAGAKLPASRPLSKTLGVSRNTIKTAYEMLQAEGYIETRHGAGSFVSSQLPEQQPSPPLTQQTPENTEKQLQLSDFAQRLNNVHQQQATSNDDGKGSLLLATGQPCMDSYPWGKWQRAVLHANRQLRHHNTYSPLGNHTLRTQIARYLQVVRGVQCTPDQVLICSGSQQAMYLALRVLVNPGEPVLVEDPGYSGIDGALTSVGAQKIAVMADEQGFRLTDGLNAAPNSRVALLTPSRNFPMGYTLSLERRLALINWAQQHNGWIIEDDYDSEFPFAGSPLTALQGLGGEDCVIYAGTFSRILHHSLRIGYLVLPPALVSIATQARRFMDGGLSVLPQLALAEFMASGDFASHVRRMRKLYQQRREILKTLIHKQLGDTLTPVSSDGSMHSVFLLPAGMSDRAVCRHANQAGLGIRPLSAYYSGDCPQDGLVIGFSGHTEAEMGRAIGLLLSVFKALN
ncbi:MAG: PLP-dependent aminotransferase family protein [Thiolinea sp.]